MDGKNKVAFVTGGGTGIGQGISIELAKAGYDVAFSYCGSFEGAKKTEAEICKYGVEALQPHFQTLPYLSQGNPLSGKTGLQWPSAAHWC